MRKKRYDPDKCSVHYLIPNPGCPVCNPDKTVPELNAAVAAARHMVVQLRFDRESFTALKELLRVKVRCIGDPMYERPADRLERESLERILKQINDMQYNDV